MKQDIHPTDYRDTVIKDSNSDFAILTKSTAITEETIKWTDGNEYPLLTVHISSESHPFYTGQEKVLDIEGRVDKFKARAKAAADKKAAATAKAKKNLNKTVKEDTAQKIGGAQPKINDMPNTKKPVKKETPVTEKKSEPAKDEKPTEVADKPEEKTES